MKWTMSKNATNVLIVLLASVAVAVTAYSCNKRWTEEFMAEERKQREPCKDVALPASTTAYVLECPQPDQKLTIEGGWVRCRCKEK